MGWRGVIRSVAAAQRRSQRASAAHARASQRQAAQARAEFLRQQAINAAFSAQQEVYMFENYLELIVSLHKDAWTPWDWKLVAEAPPPPAFHEREQAAAAALAAYAPSLVDRALGRDREARARLGEAVLAARQEDAAHHQQQYQRWEWFRRIAHAVLRGETGAYTAILDHLMPFEELEDLGSTVRVQVSAPWCAEAHVTVQDAEIVPREERKLLASGKVSVKEMPKAKYWALYQDHVCSAALRVGRELFALLPIDMAFVHVAQAAVDSVTGRDGVMPIVSVAFDRPSFSRLNFERLDPSDAVGGFTHRMKFKKTTGFSAVEFLVPGNSMTST